MGRLCCLTQRLRFPLTIYTLVLMALETLFFFEIMNNKIFKKVLDLYFVLG